MNTGQALRRPIHDRMIAGVCAGVSRYLGIDISLVRLGWVLFTLFGGSGVLAYLVAWLLIPDEYGQRSATPLVLLLVFFIVIPLLCFLFFLPFEIVGRAF